MANQQKPNLDGQGFAGSIGNLAKAVTYAATAGTKSAGSVANGSLKVTSGVAKGTAKGAGGLLSGANNLLAKGIAGAPRISFVIGVYAVAKGVQHFWRKHKANKEAQAAVEQVDTPPQPMAMQGQDTYAAAAPGQGMPMQQSGMDSMSAQLTPEQQAFLVKMQQGGPQQSAAAPQSGLRQDWAKQITDARRQQAASQEAHNARG